MTELKDKTMWQFVEDSSIKFYVHFVHDTLLVIKLNYIGRVHQTLNNFDKSLCFPIDPFENVIRHFLDLEIHNYGIALYKNSTKYWPI